MRRKSASKSFAAYFVRPNALHFAEPDSVVQHYTSSVRTVSWQGERGARVWLS
jgi:hypothetical protein